MVWQWQYSGRALYRLSILVAALAVAVGVAVSAPGGVKEPDWAALRERIQRLDTSKPEATAQLRDIVLELIQVQEAKSKELEALRVEVQTLRAQVPSVTTTRGYRGSTRAPASAPSASTARMPAGAAGPGNSATQPATGAGAPAVTVNPAAMFGKIGLKKLHRADCQFGARIKESDRVYFKSVQEAAAAGYEPCKVCKPEAVR